MGTSSDTGHVIVGVEDDLARGALFCSIVDNQLKDDVKSALNGSVGQVLTLAGTGCSVPGHSGAWVAPVASKPRSEVVLASVEAMVLGG